MAILSQTTPPNQIGANGDYDFEIDLDQPFSLAVDPNSGNGFGSGTLTLKYMNSQGSWVAYPDALAAWDGSTDAADLGGKFTPLGNKYMRLTLSGAISTPTLNITVLAGII